MKFKERRWHKKSSTYHSHRVEKLNETVRWMFFSLVFSRSFNLVPTERNVHRVMSMSVSMKDRQRILLDGCLGQTMKGYCVSVNIILILKCNCGHECRKFSKNTSLSLSLTRSLSPLSLSLYRSLFISLPPSLSLSISLPPSLSLSLSLSLSKQIEEEDVTSHIR